MTLLTAGYLFAGLALLILGAECLVRGAVRLATLLGISPLVIGLTVVAFGTSAPEAAVSIKASLSGSGDIAVGNVVGSSIANILLVLGLSALVAPLAVSRQLIRRDVPVMIVTGLLAFALAWNGQISRLDGSVLLVCLLAYTALLIIVSQREKRGQEGNALAPKQRARAAALHALLCLLTILAGLGLLTVGSDWLIKGAVNLGRALGLSELIIGLTVIAVGTSLPELATSLLAVLKGERDISVGNLVGSCIFNLLLVLGASAVVATDGLSISPNVLTFDFPVMLAVFIACFPIFFSGYRISRWEGLLFLGYYLSYILYLVMFSSGLPAIALLRHAMSWYVLPLTGATLAVIFLRAWQRQR